MKRIICLLLAMLVCAFGMQGCASGAVEKKNAKDNVAVSAEKSAKPETETKKGKQMDNKLFELAAARRSIRRYSGDHIPDEVIREILKVGMAAPSSFGHRPVEFVIVRDKISELALCKSLGGSQILGADAVIVVMVKQDRGEFWIEDGAVASAYILLAAEQYNVGACWVQIRNRNGMRKTSDEEVRELLGVPKGYAVLNLIALGGKGESKKSYSESDFDFRKIHYERY